MDSKLSLLTLFRIATAALMIPGCSASQPDTADLTIMDALVYPGPGETPIEGANLAIRDGKIIAIYTGAPRDSKATVDVNGRTATAGLWNSHVHLTDPRFTHSSESMFRQMLLKYGFTTVVDTGSELASTLALKKRIDEGELAGPTIFTVNGSFVYTDGTPSYLPGMTLPEIERPEAAESMVAAVLSSGADGIKIFSGSFQGQRDTIHLPPDVIRAIADAAHSRQSFVFSHPTDRLGLSNAVENGVDVLAHTAPQAGPLGSELISIMKARNVALIPTLKLWRIELMQAGVEEKAAMAFQKIGIRQLAEYHNADGEIIIGTDVGFISDFDTAEEFQLMSAAGMSFDDILASMTTTPSRRFAQGSARLEVGAPADIVVYKDSPSLDVTAFSRVAYTVKGGRVVYRGE